MTARTPRTRSESQPANSSPEQLSLLFEESALPPAHPNERGAEQVAGDGRDLELPLRGTHGSEGTRSVAPNPHPPAPTTTRHRWGSFSPAAADAPKRVPSEPTGDRVADTSEAEPQVRRESFPEKLARWKRESGEAVKAKARRMVPGAFGRPQRSRVGEAPTETGLDAQSQLYERARVFLERMPEADQRPQPSLELSLRSDESWMGLVVSLGLTAAAFAAAFLIA